MDLIIIGKYKFPVEIALSAEEQSRGLMNCYEPKIMAFPGKKSIKSFWMKNTPMPLDLIFACDGAIVDRKKGSPFSLGNISSDYESDLIVEFPRGVLDHFPINIGDDICLNYSIKTIAKKFNFTLNKLGDL
jgi:hypothetical protein